LVRNFTHKLDELIKNLEKEGIKVNIFNRIIMVILLLCLIVFSIVVMVNVFAGLFEWSTIADRIINYTTNLNPYILEAILFLVLVIALIILIFEFYRRKIKIANVASDQSGKIMISLKTVSSQIEEKLIRIEGILDPKVKIVPMSKGIIINTSSKLIKGVNMAEKTKEIRDTASEFASKNLGFRVMKSNYAAVEFISPEIKILNKFFDIKKEPEISVEGKEPKNMVEETETPLPEAENK
jgi:hypothetical protein